MTIDEAIVVLENYIKPTKLIPYKDIDNAIKLGIEALKCVKGHQSPFDLEREFILPGEAEE